MTDESSALVGRFWSLLQQAGCRAMPAASSGTLLVGRDLTEISAGLAELPGSWRLDTSESITGGAESARVLPPRGSVLPHFAFARREGFITVRMIAAGSAGSLVFGVFATANAALDAIHNDVMSRLVYRDAPALTVAAPQSA
jgi:hypothetical protein